MTHREVSLIAVNIGRKNNPIKKKNSYKKKTLETSLDYMIKGQLDEGNPLT